MELTPEQTKAVTKRITELGDRKELVTQDDLPYIVSDVLSIAHLRIRKNWSVTWYPLLWIEAYSQREGKKRAKEYEDRSKFLAMVSMMPSSRLFATSIR